MTRAAVNINNLTSTNLSIDTKLGFKKPLRRSIAAGASVDVGDVATLDELNADPTIQRLLAAPAKISVTVVRGTTDIPGVHDDLSDASGIGRRYHIVKALTAGTPGAADDVTVYSANAPYSLKVLGATLSTSTAIAMSTVTLRSATGGGGSALSKALSSGATGKAVDDTTGSVPTVAKGGTVVIRRSDRGVAGTMDIEVQRTG